jgi:hypothetical protein
MTSSGTQQPEKALADRLVNRRRRASQRQRCPPRRVCPSRRVVSLPHRTHCIPGPFRSRRAPAVYVPTQEQRNPSAPPWWSMASGSSTRLRWTASSTATRVRRERSGSSVSCPARRRKPPSVPWSGGGNKERRQIGGEPQSSAGHETPRPPEVASPSRGCRRQEVRPPALVGVPAACSGRARLALKSARHPARAAPRPARAIRGTGRAASRSRSAGRLVPAARRRSAKTRRTGLARIATTAGRDSAVRKDAGPSGPVRLRPRTDEPDARSRGQRSATVATCARRGNGPRARAQHLKRGERCAWPEWTRAEASPRLESGRWVAMRPRLLTQVRGPPPPPDPKPPSGKGRGRVDIRAGRST